MKQSLIRLALVAVAVATVSVAVVIVNQSAQLVELAARAHPMAGQVLFWALAGFYAACLVVPLLMWLRLPRTLVPPARDEGPEFERYLRTVGARLRRNPRLATRTLETRGQVEEALKELDGAADELTKAAASRVFLTTALSQNGSLDALFVLGWQLRLVWDIAHVFRQRPSLRDMGWLYANVAGSAFVAGEIEDLDLAQQIQPVVQSALGSAAGSIPGLGVASSVVAASIVSGSANAFLTLRVGVVARRYCSTLIRPEKRMLRRAAFAEAAGMLGSIAAAGSKRVVGALARASGRTVASTVTGIGSRVKSGAGSVGNKVKNGAGTVIDTLTMRRKSEDG